MKKIRTIRTANGNTEHRLLTDAELRNASTEARLIRLERLVKYAGPDIKETFCCAPFHHQVENGYIGTTSCHSTVMERGEHRYVITFCPFCGEKLS